MSSDAATMRPTTRDEWLQALAELPRVTSGTQSKIPSFYFGHGRLQLIPRFSLASRSAEPGLLWPDHLPSRFSGDIQAPKGPLVQFLSDFGPALLRTYKPRGIVVFSAHWETSGETLVTDYGDENPLLYDYYNFPDELYKLKFSSRGDSALSAQVVDMLVNAGIRARTSKVTENRGEDGRGFMGPGLDHGVFIPFIIMFGESFRDIPIVQVSIDSSLAPEKEWALGSALDSLRGDGILILSGGLPVHTFRDWSAFAEKTAKAPFKSFCTAIYEATEITAPEERKAALVNLTKHPAFRMSNPREEHFVPIYVAAGAGEAGSARVMAALYGAPTLAFGI